MAYIGNQQTQGFSSIPAKQDLTGATGTSLTLSHAVASAEGIDLFINNVRQESGEAYSIGGDGVTVTLTGSVVASDDIYVVYNSLALQTTVPPDASVSTAKIIDGDVTSAKLDTNIQISGILTEPNKEYFQVELTTLQDGLTDQTVNIVDFGGKGTVKYDTKSNFDSANDAYLLDSSDGVYLINFSVGIKSDAITVEELVDASAAVFIATDGSTYASVNGAGARVVDHSGGRPGSVMLNGSFIYKSTTATTKVLLKTVVNTSGGSYEHSRTSSDNVNTGDSSFNTANCTFLSVVRIA